MLRFPSLSNMIDGCTCRMLYYVILLLYVWARLTRCHVIVFTVLTLLHVRESVDSRATVLWGWVVRSDATTRG